jgi:type VI secretion system protein VasD
MGGTSDARTAAGESLRDVPHPCQSPRPYAWLGLVLSAITCIVQGCGATIPPPSCTVPNAIELEIETSDRVNADADGRSLPTLVRTYQLSDLSRLQASSFEDIWEHAKETLGATLQAVEEFTMYPGQVNVRHLQRNAKADFVVGFAVFRNPIGAAWRTIQELPLAGDPCRAHNDEHAAPRLSDLRIRMFLEEYRIDSVNNYAALPKRSCDGKAGCAGAAAADELPEERRHRRLRDFEDDPSRPKPTTSNDAQP